MDRHEDQCEQLYEPLYEEEATLGNAKPLPMSSALRLAFRSQAQPRRASDMSGNQGMIFQRNPAWIIGDDVIIIGARNFSAPSLTTDVHGGGCGGNSADRHTSLQAVEAHFGEQLPAWAQPVWVQPSIR
jgi:hypothetical protein